MSESNNDPFFIGDEPLDTNTYNEEGGESKVTSCDNQATDPKSLPDVTCIESAIEALKIFAKDGIAAPCYIPLDDGGAPISRQIKLADEEALEALLKEATQRGNVYFQPNPVEVFLGPFDDPRDKVEAQRRAGYLAVGAPFKARREDVPNVNWFYADIDPIGQEGDGGILFDKNRERIVATLRNEAKLCGAGIPGLPTVIVDSGGGYWGFWKLETPIVLDGQTLNARIDQAENIANYNRGLQVALTGLLGEAAKVDACVDICRIARLPGLVNIPHDGKRARGQVERLARIVAHDPQRLYKGSQFRQAERPAGSTATPSHSDTRKIMKSIPPTERVPGADAGEKIHWLKDHYPNIPTESLHLIFEFDYSDRGNRKGTLPKRSDGKTDRSGGYWRVLLAILHAYPEFPLQLLVGILIDRQFEQLSDGIYNVRGYKGRSGCRRSEKEADREARRQVAQAVIKRAKQEAEAAEVATARDGEAGSANDKDDEQEPDKAARIEPKDVGDRIIIYPSKPVVTGRLFVEKCYPTLLYHNFDWLVHAGPIYKKLEDGRIEADLASFLATTWWYKIVEGNKELQKCDPNPRLIADVVSMLKKDCRVFRDVEAIEAPCWLGEAQGRTPPKHILACRNGLYDLERGQLLPHTPDFFTRNALEFDYDENPNWPKRFMQFLYEIWPEAYAEIEADGLHGEAHPGRMKGVNNEITLLQEIMGYLLVPDTSQQKIFLFVGAAGGGKGTLARIIGHLVGKSNYAAPALEDLCETFGLEPLIGKQLAMVTDVQMGRYSDEAAITRNLLRISGEDNITIRRMRQKHWEGRLATRFLLIANKMITLPNIGGLSRRFVPLFFLNSFNHVKDPRLEEKLIAELPGISQWAIVGWRRLNQRGAFSVPDIVNEGIQDFKETSSYELAFLLEDCDFGPDQKDAVTSKDDLYAAYTRHALARGYKPKSYPVFFREVYSVSDQKIKEYRPRAIAGDPDGKRKAMVKGVKLIKLRVNKDDRLGIADPQATLLLNGADAVAEDLLSLIESLGRDGQHQVVAALLGRLQRPQAA